VGDEQGRYTGLFRKGPDQGTETSQILARQAGCRLVEDQEIHLQAGVGIDDTIFDLNPGVQERASDTEHDALRFGKPP
jgi:ribosomal protein L27